LSALAIPDRVKVMVALISEVTLVNVQVAVVGPVIPDMLPAEIKAVYPLLIVTLKTA
jgi:hypothetical protein